MPAKLAPPPIPGRCVLAETKLHAHVATPPGPLPEAVAMIAERWGDVAPKPRWSASCPTSVTVAELGAPAQLEAEPWRLPVGIRESDLEPAVLEVYEGEHVLIAGPAALGQVDAAAGHGRVPRAGPRQGVDASGASAGVARRWPQAGLDRCAVGDGRGRRAARRPPASTAAGWSCWSTTPSSSTTTTRPSPGCCRRGPPTCW